MKSADSTQAHNASDSSICGDRVLTPLPCSSPAAAAATSNLPRQARARIGHLTDPLPEGKQLDAAPE
jgi:hypothetical protein